jgi:hypothetical protein
MVESCLVVDVAWADAVRRPLDAADAMW